MFILKKAQLTRYEGLEISYTTVDDATLTNEKDALVLDGNQIEYKVKSMATPHSDLTGLFPMFIPVVADLFGMVDLTGIELAIDDESTRILAGKMNPDIYNRIRVKGVEYTSGNGVIIHWEYLAKNSAIAKCATPKICLDKSALGYESYISSIAEKIKYEVELYLTKGKRAQLELFEESTE